MLSTYVTLALNLYNAGVAVEPVLAKALKYTQSGTAPTADDWSEIQALEAANSATLQALDAQCDAAFEAAAIADGSPAAS